MKISCDEIRDSLSACIDGELPPEMTAVIERHLEHCPACRELAGELRAVSGLLHNLPRRGAPAGLSEEILGRLERHVLLSDLDEPQPAAPHVTDRAVVQHRRSLWPRIAAVAACIALAAGIALLQMTTPHGQQPQYAQSSPDGTAAETMPSGRGLTGTDVAFTPAAPSPMKSLAFDLESDKPGNALDGVGENDFAAGSASGMSCVIGQARRQAQGNNRLVIVTEENADIVHGEITEVARDLDLPLKMTQQRVIGEGDNQYLVSTFNGTASGEQLAALNFRIANNDRLNVADGTGLFAATPQSQQMARIANSYDPELSQKLQRDVTLQNLALRSQTRESFSQRIRGAYGEARGEEPSDQAGGENLDRVKAAEAAGAGAAEWRRSDEAAKPLVGSSLDDKSAMTPGATFGGGGSGGGGEQSDPDEKMEQQRPTETAAAALSRAASSPSDAGETLPGGRSREMSETARRADNEQPRTAVAPSTPELEMPPRLEGSMPGPLADSFTPERYAAPGLVVPPAPSPPAEPKTDGRTTVTMSDESVPGAGAAEADMRPASEVQDGVGRDSGLRNANTRLRLTGLSLLTLVQPNLFQSLLAGDRVSEECFGWTAAEPAGVTDDLSLSVEIEVRSRMNVAGQTYSELRGEASRTVPEATDSSTPAARPARD